MSKIGKKKIEKLEGVEFVKKENTLEIKGSKGQIVVEVPSKIEILEKENTIAILRQSDDKYTKALHGTVRAQIANAVLGVSVGFEKKLELKGVGFRAEVADEKLVLSLGYTQPVEIQPQEGITFSVEKNIISVGGIDKQKVGEVAAKIRALRLPDPYKGKGIRYLGEEVKRKPGKIAKVVSA